METGIEPFALVKPAIASMEAFGKLPPQFLSKLHAYVGE